VQILLPAEAFPGRREPSGGLMGYGPSIARGMGRYRRLGMRPPKRVVGRSLIVCCSSPRIRSREANRLLTERVHNQTAFEGKVRFSLRKSRMISSISCRPQG